MRALALILGSIRVIDVHYTESGVYRSDMWLCSASGKSIPEPQVTKKGVYVVAVTISGHGVVTKPADSGTAAKVRSDAAAFIQSETADSLSFVRREQLAPLLEKLATQDIYPVAIECGIGVQETADRLYATLHAKDLFRIDLKGSSIAQAFARRLMAPMLGFFLLLLTVNALVAPQLQTERQKLQAEVTAAQKGNAHSANLTGERQKMIQEFVRRMPVGYAKICDRIGECTPPRITLTELWIEPITKRIEEKKPLIRNQRQIAITGNADSSAEIGSFTEALTAISEVTEVKLIAVERQRDAGLQFKIEVGL